MRTHQERSQQKVPMDHIEHIRREVLVSGWTPPRVLAETAATGAGLPAWPRTKAETRER
jgi:hypothetical protein